MIKQILPLIQRELSGQRAFAHVAEISQHHRIQASPGFREAAEICAEALRQEGLACQVVSYPSSFQHRYWTQRMWEEWSCESATLELQDPSYRKLADFNIDKMSIIQRSCATPPEGIKAPLILLDRGAEEAAYEGIDFTGAIVFTDGDLNTVRRWAVEKRGAVGIVSDRMMEFLPVRHRYDIPDAMMYTSFWWTGTEKPCFGFVLSPKNGDILRQICRKQAAAHQADNSQPQYPSVFAKVEAKLYPGAIENVEAFIPGETEEEVLLTAHLCHPQASANDNASGSGTLMEVARVLQKLIATGALPKPKRGIRFLLVPEMTGTYAWLAQNEAKIPHILAGLNLDMVGENQELCDSALTVVYPPHASHSFMGDLAAAVLSEVAKEVSSLGGAGEYGLFRHATTPFTAGSDHYILTDPTVNIPAPMLIQWPDKFYHTSADTIDKVDPRSLYRVGCLTAAYAWAAANLGKEEQAWIFSLSREFFLEEIGALLTASATAQASLLAADRPAALVKTLASLQHLTEMRIAQIASFVRFLPASDRDAFAQDHQRQAELLKKLAEALWQEHLAGLGIAAAVEVDVETTDNPDYLRVPKRTFRGPWSNRGWIEQLPAADQEAWQATQKQYGFGAMGLANLLVYWIDGQRSILELNRLVELEAGRGDLPFCSDYLNWLAKLGLIEWV